MRIVAITQARMGSTRLPGKVMMDLAGEPMLVRHVNRVQRMRTLDGVIVAASTQPADDVIVRLCKERGWTSFRGSEEDLLDRYYQAALQHRADVVVRVTSDCPLIEPAVVDRLVGEFLDRQPDLDYACNFLPRKTFPHGLDAEVMRFDALERAWRESRDPVWREHVTLPILRNPDRYRIHGMTNDVDYSYLRWTVDEAEDLEFVRRIYDHFGHDRFSWHEVIALLDTHPEWTEINRSVKPNVVR
ncbi:MAG: glycosyltransferase family protein [Pseudomonadota bacterium]